jgi:hypothetical protein
MLSHERHKRKLERITQISKTKTHTDSLGNLKITPWQPGFELGRSISMKGLSLPMATSVTTKKQEGMPDKRSFEEVIYDLADFERVNKLSAEASLQQGTWYLKAIAEYSRNLNLNSNSIYCLMGTSYLSASEQVFEQGSLTKAVLQKFKSGKLIDFEKDNGAHFVSGDVKGALYLCCITIKMESEDDVRAIKAELGGAGFFDILKANISGQSKAATRLARGRLSFNISVQGLDGFASNTIRTISEMEKQHERFRKEIDSASAKLGPILAFCEPVERVLPVVFNFTTSDFEAFNVAVKKDINALEAESKTLREDTKIVDYEDFYHIQTKTRGFFEVDSHIDITIYDIPEETKAKIITSRSISENYEANIENGIYKAHFKPTWGGGWYESVLEIAFSGPKKNHPDTAHALEAIATRKRWLEALHRLVINTALVGSSIEKMSIYLATILLKANTNSQEPNLYGLQADNNSNSSNEGGLFTAVGAALDSANIVFVVEDLDDKNTNNAGSQSTAASVKIAIVNYINNNPALKTQITDMLKRDENKSDNYSQRRNSEQKSESADDYLQRLSVSTVSTTHVELAALPYSIGRPVVLITPGNKHDTMLIHEDFANNRPIFIQYKRGHYQALHVPANQNPRDILLKVREIEFQRRHEHRQLTPDNPSSSTELALHAAPSHTKQAATDFLDSQYGTHQPGANGFFLKKN